MNINHLFKWKYPKSFFTSKSILTFSMYILCILLLYFPKGGFKIGPIPITWGYLFLGMISFLGLIKLKKLSKRHLQTFLLIMPFQLLFIISFLLFGISNTGRLISIFINFFIFPIIFFIIFPAYLEKVNKDKLYQILKNGIFFISSFGIFLFFYKIITGNFLEIPGLTMNISEYGALEKIKYINRKFLFKLISTYNNGNIFGVCMLMFLPFYLKLEKNKKKQILVLIALFLTLSRTVWIGMVFSLPIYFFIKKRSGFSNLFWFLFFIIGSFSAFILTIFSQINYILKIQNLLSLGNRIKHIKNINEINILPSNQIDTLSEMIYVSALKNWGFLGLIFFILSLLAPIIIFLLKNKGKITYDSKYLLLGSITYLIVAISDGCIMLIPTMCFYWFLSSLLLIKSKTNDSSYQLTTIRYL